MTALVCIISPILAFLFYSCCEDCPVGPTQPKPYKGCLYATDFASEWLYKIDIETDSLVDSVQYVTDEVYSPGAISVSSDGKYLAAGYYNQQLTSRTTILYNAQTLDQIHSFDYQFYPLFIPTDNLFLGFGHDSIYIYSMPSFSPIYSEPSPGYTLPILRTDQSLIYLHGTLVSESFDSTLIAAYDYKNRGISEQWFIHDSRDSLVDIYSFDIHPDGRRLYCVTGSDYDGINITCYDLQEREIIFQTPFSTTTGSLKISPDAQEIYVTYPGYFMQYDIPGIIFVFDTETGNYIYGISLHGQVDEYPSVPLYAREIAFTPTGEKAYVGSGRLSQGSGTVSVIDTRERKIIKNIWPDMGHFIQSLCIGPKN
jgi:DNA-binding beta-propeller fold protein YncE